MSDAGVRLSFYLNSFLPKIILVKATTFINLVVGHPNTLGVAAPFLG